MSRSGASPSFRKKDLILRTENSKAFRNQKKLFGAPFAIATNIAIRQGDIRPLRQKNANTNLPSGSFQSDRVVSRAASTFLIGTLQRNPSFGW